MNRAYKMEPWALGADLNFLSVIFFSPPLPFSHHPLHSFSVFFLSFLPSLSPPSSPPLPLLIAIFKRHWAHCFCSF